MGRYNKCNGAVEAIFGVLLMLAGLSCGNFPVLDVDTNMRIVLVPYDVPVGTIIYRLRASDSDNNFPLSFEVLGAIGKSILSLRFLGCDEGESLCQADVVLKKALDKGRTYEFQLQVKDTEGDYTKVHSVITATTGTANFNPTFMPRIIHLDESTPVGTELEKFVVAKNELNSRHVLLEIRDKGERISLRQRLVSNNKTEGTLLLKKPLNYESDPWFTFQLLAMNAYTNTSCDTRNILVSPVIVAVHDVQDTPPYFTSLPASVELNSSMKPGDLIAKVKAEDGDKQNKRLIRYGFLTDSNPFVVFFDLDPMSGEIHLRRNITELLTMAKPNEPIEMTVIAEEILIPESGRLVGKSSSSRSSSSLDNNNTRTMGKITFWFGDSSFGPAVFSSDKYVGEVKENSVSGTLVHFGSVVPRVSHQHPTEIIALSLQSGGASNKIDNGPQPHISNNNNEFGFQVIPSQGMGNFSFEIRVADSKLLDYETMSEFTFMIVAVTSSGMSSEAQVTIHVRDENDESPVFTQSEYRVELMEHPAKGTRVLQVQATDKDTTGNYGKVTYSLLGSEAFRLDPVTGEITVQKPELIDREMEPEMRLYVEAKDGGYADVVGGEQGVVRNIGTAMVVIKLLDKNDHPPEFLQKYYQAVLNPGLTELKEPLYLKAFDPDDGANAQIRYQIKDNRFFVDPVSGEFRLRGGFHRDPRDGDNPFLGSVKVYAYDLGNPKLTSETSVQLFAEEMVTREIQFIFPATPDRIRKNKTSFEIMLSKLSGGVVAIQNVAPYHRYPRTGAQQQGEVETSSRDPSTGDDGIPARFRQNQENSQDSNPVSRRAADLSSSSDKSLVTATVQYPVSATPTRVDLSQIPSVYNPDTDQGGGNGNSGGSGGGDGTAPDRDRIKVYEAENRALFWILISFLLILLLLFVIFLCCVYCPWCWLYGHCYSKGDKAREHSGRSLLIEKRRQSDAHSRHKTYPEKVEDDEVEYDREGFPRPPPARGHRHARREAWSGEDRKVAWRTSHQSPRSIRRYRGTPPPRSRKVGPQPHETDVALEDWEFEGPPRPRDQAEEIGSRWQLQQQPGPPIQMQPDQQQMIPIVPVPMGVQPSRRVAFGPGGQPIDDSYMRRSQEVFLPNDSQIQRAGYLVRTAPKQIVPAAVQDERAMSHLQQRKTRFFRTETGEVLQFGDYDGDEGKDLLIKRYIDEQQPKEILDQFQQQQQSYGSQHMRPPTPGISMSQPRLEEAGRGPLPVAYVADPEPPPQQQQQQQGSTVDRPKAAIVTRRNQKNVSLSKDVTFEDDDIEEEKGTKKADPQATPSKHHRSVSRSDTKKSRSKRSESEGSEDERREGKEKAKDERDDYQQQQRRYKKSEKTEKSRRRPKSPTPQSEEYERGRSRSRTPSRRRGGGGKEDSQRISKSPSRSKTRSASPPHPHKSKSESVSKSPSRSKSRTRSRSVSPQQSYPDEREKRRQASKGKQHAHDKEGKHHHHKLRRHHPIQQSKASSKGDEYERDRDRAEHRSHHRSVKHKDSKQQQSVKGTSREDMAREKTKSLEPSLVSLPFSIDDSEQSRHDRNTSEQREEADEGRRREMESTSDVRERSPPELKNEEKDDDDDDEVVEAINMSRRGSRRRSSVTFRQSSEEQTTQGMQSMVDINVIPPSSAMTDSSYNPRDPDDVMMSDAAPPTPPDAEQRDSGGGTQQPETTISTTERESRREENDEDEVGAVVIEPASDSHHQNEEDEKEKVPEPSTSAKASASPSLDDGRTMERTDTIAETGRGGERLENEMITLASQSTLDIAEVEAQAAAVAPSDSVEIPPGIDGDAEPSRAPEEDDDSGIGMAGYLSRRNKMLEKKSVFTIAYDEVAQSTMMRPDTRGSTGETENEMMPVKSHS